LQWNAANARFDLSDTLRVSGNLESDGSVLTLNAGGGEVNTNIDIVANLQRRDNGILRYNITAREWELSNNGRTFSPISTLATSTSMISVAQVYEAGSTTFNTPTSISWNGADTVVRIVDPEFSHSTVNKPNIIIVENPGLYEIDYNIVWDTTSNSRRTALCQFFVNGALPGVPIGSSYGYARNSIDDN
jgi:hypothetical protein